MQRLWEDLEQNLDDSRWREVIRLLVAGLKSDLSQDFLVMAILRSDRCSDRSRALVLGGLLLDGVAAAESASDQIVPVILSSIVSSDTTEQLRPLATILKAWTEKVPSNRRDYMELLETSVRIQRMPLLSASLLARVTDPNRPDHTEVVPTVGGSARILLLALLEHVRPANLPKALRAKLARFALAVDGLSIHSSYANFIASAAQAVRYVLEPSGLYKQLFDQQLMFVAGGYGPYEDLLTNCRRIAAVAEPHSGTRMRTRRTRGDLMALEKAITSVLPEHRGFIQPGHPPSEKTSVYSIAKQRYKQALRQLTPDYERTTSEVEIRPQSGRLRDLGPRTWEAFTADSRAYTPFLER